MITKFAKSVRKYDNILNGHVVDDDTVAISGTDFEVGLDLTVLTIDDMIIRGEFLSFTDTGLDDYYNLEELNIDGHTIHVSEIVFIGSEF